MCVILNISPVFLQLNSDHRLGVFPLIVASLLG